MPYHRELLPIEVDPQAKRLAAELEAFFRCANAAGYVGVVAIGRRTDENPDLVASMVATVGADTDGPLVTQLGLAAAHQAEADAQEEQG